MSEVKSDRDRARGALVGLAVGDAIGTTVEFRSRGSFTPLTDMVGGGPFGLQAGQWTDDTSMALCLGVSLVESRGFDANDQMQRYCDWRDRGYLSSTGTCFDIGNTVSAALERYRSSADPWSGSSDPRSAGNGSIMRLAPIPIAYWRDRDRAIQYAGESSRTTHAALECIDACRLLSSMLLRAFAGESKTALLVSDTDLVTSASIKAIANGDYRDLPREVIQGSGYVVKSLEAALWSFWQSQTFAEAVLLAANLGDDADTTAAICGQVAGAYYGFDAIPTAWRDHLFDHDMIVSLADQLYALFG